MTNAKTKSAADKSVKNGLLANDILNNLMNVAEKQQKWHNGAFKKANEILYRILTECYVITDEIRNSELGVKMKLDEMLKERQITFNKGTSIEAKVIRAVFDIDSSADKRVFKYKRVLEMARTDNIPAADFAQWVIDGNGIENVQSKKATEHTKRQAERIVEELAKAYALSMNAPLVSLDTAKASSGNFSNLSVALVRHNKEAGTKEIIGVSDNNTITFNLFKALKDTLMKSAEQLLNAENDEDNQQKVNDVRNSLDEAEELPVAA